MINREGKVQISNGSNTKWVAPADVDKWQPHGYRPVSERPVAAVLRPVKTQVVEPEVPETSQDTANKEIE